ncbi:MAG: pyridine nucleotide-disulfide oxidoreductase [Actinobacteria bacterium]|nr:pyridine nucleotide-disulfide oxidoreductase [Actinomycetota bacterium]
MEKDSLKIVIIGGVAAGTSAAVKARRKSENAEIIIYEKYKYISYGTCGLPYYVSGRIKDIESLVINTVSMFQKRFNIAVNILHEVLAVNPGSRTIKVKDLRTGREFQDSYDKLIIATGSSRIILDPGLNAASNSFELVTQDDAVKLKEYLRHLSAHRKVTAGNRSDLAVPDTEHTEAVLQNAVIAGGGYIGLELVEAFLSNGLKVSIIEKMSQILPVFDFEIIEYLENYLTERGIRILKNQQIKSFEKNAGGEVVTIFTTDGTEISCNLLFLSAGTKPEVRIALECGITTGNSGAIIVDEYMRTNKPDIFAAGDCCECRDFVSGQRRAYNLASIANIQGRCAGYNAAGGNERFTDSIPTSVIKVLDVAVAKTGISFSLAKQSGINAAKVEFHALNHAGYYPGASMMHMMVIYDRNSGTILGFEAIGKEGVDKKTDIMSVAIRSRMKLWELTALNLCYHPEYGSAKDPVNILGMIGENIRRQENIFIDTEQLRQWIGKGEGLIILDVRTRREYDTGHIEGAINIPLDDLRDNLGILDRKKKIVVYCRTSYRSYLAFRILKNNGFENLWNLNGSYLSWIRKL